MNKILSYSAREIFQANYTFDFFNFNDKKNAEKTYQLRHKVYCQELGFEEGKENFETDEYDKHSHGCVISSRLGIKEAIASVRLIPKSESYELPCLLAFKNEFPEEYTLIKQKIEHLNYSEISRLVILKNFRQKQIMNKNTRNIHNYLLLFLFASTFFLSSKNDLMLFLCEKKLINFLKKTGFQLEYLSDKSVEHKGTRYLVSINIKHLKELLKKPNHTIDMMASIISLLKNKSRKNRLKLFLALESVLVLILLSLDTLKYIKYS